MEQFDSVKEMIENLRSEDPELRLSSMRGIHLIATTLGPERTRDELLLYLTDYLDDNDEVLRVFANAMGTMVQEVGGVAHVGSLLTALEILASLDEITVREEAVTSLQLLGEAIFRKSEPASSGSGRAAAEFTDMLERMSKGTPQSRGSACYLIATVYAGAPASGTGPMTKPKLLELFRGLCKDDEIMVRRAACVSMGKTFAPTLGPNSSVELVPSLKALAKDASDGVRLQAVTTAAALLQVLSEVQHAPVLVCVKALASDSSWRVRYMVADSLGTLSTSMSPTDAARYTAPIFQSLCQDAEPEIRASAVYNMAGILSVCRKPATKREVLVAGTRLASDESSHVRASLASAMLKSVAHVPREMWDSTIVATCTALLGDTDPTVRLALVSGFSSMGNTLEARELAPKLVPTVISLSGDPKWRLREVVVAQVPYIITSLGRNSEEEVVNVCVTSLSDRVATIREAAVQSCCKLVAENGSPWAMRSLFPRLDALARDGTYLHRVALCHLHTALAGVAGFDKATCTAVVWPVLQRMRADSVPNVRLAAARAILALQAADKVDHAVAESAIAELRKDECEDVRDTANGRVTRPGAGKKQAVVGGREDG